MAILNKQSVKKTGKARKEKLVAELTEKLDNANGLVFTDYQGLTHQQLEELKKELRKLDAKIFIAKNSLLKLALDKSKNFKDAKDNESFDGPTATLFIEGDMIEPLKSLQKAIKSFGKPSIKFGILEGITQDEAGVLKIASLPGRETLLAQLLMLLNSPIQGFTTGLNSIPQKFVMTLDAIAKNKPSEEQKSQATPPAVQTQTEPTEKSTKDTSPADPSSPATDSTTEPKEEHVEATPENEVENEKLKVKNEDQDTNN